MSEEWILDSRALAVSGVFGGHRKPSGYWSIDYRLLARNTLYAGHWNGEIPAFPLHDS
jgi:hypothetical protein